MADRHLSPALDADTPLDGYLNLNADGPVEDADTYELHTRAKHLYFTSKGPYVRYGDLDVLIAGSRYPEDSSDTAIEGEHTVVGRDLYEDYQWRMTMLAQKVHREYRGNYKTNGVSDSIILGGNYHEEMDGYCVINAAMTDDMIVRRRYQNSLVRYLDEQPVWHGRKTVYGTQYRSRSRTLFACLRKKLYAFGKQHRNRGVCRYHSHPHGYRTHGAY